MVREKVVGGGARILLVDDDAGLCELVTEYLTARGFAVDTEGDGERGLARALQGQHELMVLDVMLPTLDGFEVLRRLRASGGESALIPVVMLTAHGDEVDRIVGLELGADDYLPKPFNVRELLARMSAILRRMSTTSAGQTNCTPPPERIVVDDVEMDTGARRVRRLKRSTEGAVNPQERAKDGVAEDGGAEGGGAEGGGAEGGGAEGGGAEGGGAEGSRVGEEGTQGESAGGRTLDLTATEFDLLYVLLRAAGRVVTREELAREALGRRLLPYDRSLDMYISKLRRKLGPGAGGAERLTTVRGVGYIFVKEE